MISFLADCHLANHRRFGGPTTAGLNARCRAVLEVLRAARDRSKALRAPLVSLGDLFDSARPEPQVTSAAQEALSGVEAYALLGNHEMVSTAEGDHALGPLDGYDLIEVVETDELMTVGDVDLLFVPFRPGRAEDWLPGAIEKADYSLEYSTPKGRARVLCIHLGIRDASTPPWLKDAHDSVPIEMLRALAKEHRLDAVVAGNWHSRRQWSFDEVEIMQIGALVPTGFDNEGLIGYGTLASFDPNRPIGERLAYEELVGPRFLKLQTYDMVPRAGGNRLYVQVTTSPEGAAVCEAQVREAVEAGDFAGGEVVLDGAVIQEAAREAAESARSEDTLDGALSAFVEGMEAPDPAARARVLARCRRYLAAEGGA